MMFLHGLESGPNGSKAKALEARFGDLSAPDCRAFSKKTKSDVEGRVKIALESLGSQPNVLVGSSFGGLIACLVAHRHPELVQGLILCAPALHITPSALEIGHLGCPITIIHGREDDIVPIKVSRLFSAGKDYRLIEVQDDHRLSKSLDVILEETQSLLQSI